MTGHLDLEEHLRGEHLQNGRLFSFLSFQTNIWQSVLCKEKGAWKKEKIFFVLHGNSRERLDIDQTYGAPVTPLIREKFQSHWRSMWWMATNRGGNITEEPSEMGKVEDKRRGEECTNRSNNRRQGLDLHFTYLE